MPWKDKEKKNAWQREYNQRRIKEGYGKALYRRRNRVYQNEAILREAVRKALYDLQWVKDDRVVDLVRKNLRSALWRAPEVREPSFYMRDSDASDEQ